MCVVYSLLSLTTHITHLVHFKNLTTHTIPLSHFKPKRKPTPVTLFKNLTTHTIHLSHFCCEIYCEPDEWYMRCEVFKMPKTRCVL
jgi:hypothetical protein